MMWLFLVTAMLRPAAGLLAPLSMSSTALRPSQVSLLRPRVTKVVAQAGWVTVLRPRIVQQQRAKKVVAQAGWVTGVDESGRAYYFNEQLEIFVRSPQLSNRELRWPGSLACLRACWNALLVQIRPEEW